MKSKVKKNENENQVALFELIRKKQAQANEALVDVVSELFGIGRDASYRRIRGDTSITCEETLFLCRHFNISMDSLANIVLDKNYIQCMYSPLLLDNSKDYLDFIKSISYNLEQVRNSPPNEIIMSAVDIPIFRNFAYKELWLFRLFSWSKNLYGFQGNFEDFISIFENNNPLTIDFQNKIVSDFLLIPSTEIWTSTTADYTVKLIEYHAEVNHFNSKDSFLILCEHLLELINTMEIWSAIGVKGSGNAPYKFYVSERDIANTFVILKSKQSKAAMLRLYTINGLVVSDERFCNETELWLQNLTQRSMLISESSERERVKFFNAQKQKVKSLIDKIIPMF